MVTITIRGKLADRIIQQSQEDDLSEDFNAMDYAGGNFDDAFSMGVDRGYIDLCKDIVAEAEITE